jgi:diguanylate cyclase (GGDEF)-like protein/PAS domain S-box-containing protein
VVASRLYDALVNQRPRHPSTLRQFMLLRVSGLVAITALLVGASFWLFALLPMGQQIAKDQFDTATKHMEADLATVFTPPIQLLGMAHGWLAGQAPDLNSPDVFNRLFQPILETSPHITSVVAGTATGQGWLLLRQADGSWRNRMTDLERWGSRHQIIERFPDERISRHWQQQDYDPRTRPWFTAAQAGGSERKVQWTVPYTFFTTGEPGITASILSRLRDGRDFVIGFDVKLRDMSQSTVNAPVGKHGMALIITDDERVLALPARPDSVTQADWFKRVLQPVSGLALPPVDAALLAWRQANRNTMEAFGFNSEGTPWLGRIRPYALGAQRLWVVTLAPAQDFAPDWMALAGWLGGALALALGLAMLVARRETLHITGPLERLARTSAQIGRLDFRPGQPLRSGIAEIAQLASAQSTMLELLQDNQQQLDTNAQALRGQIAALTTAEAELISSEERFRNLVENLNDVVFALSPSGDFTYVSPQWKMAFGYELGETIGHSFLPFVHPEDVPVCVEFLQRVIATGGNHSGVEYRVRCKDGQYVWYRANASLLRDAHGGAPTFVGLGRDISESKKAAEALQLAASVFTHAREGIVITDALGNIIDVNATFTLITGYSREEALGKNPRFLSSGRQSKEYYAALWIDLLQHDYWYGELWNRRKSGESYAELMSISTVRNNQGEISYFVGLFSDVTALKEHERRLEHLAHYDALTSLPNRVLLGDRLQQAKNNAQRRGDRLGVAYLDIDGFKVINDRHGHEVGDQLLVTVALRMKAVLREGDTLARLGGDEFVAVLVDLVDIEACTPLLTRLLAAASEPVQVGDIVAQVSASLGVTFYPQPEGVNADQLLRQADQAMYQAKLAGKNRFHVFDAEQDRSVRGHHESVERIRRALIDNELVLYYQPKVNMRKGIVVGAEALIRWQHPENGLVAPGVFLPTIEDHPLALSIGEWVLHSALTQMQAWHDQGLDWPVSVNIGALQLQQPNFPQRLGEILAQHPNVEPSSLELEVLETSALEDISKVSQIIRQCRDLGVHFALDDFGTGYSSLTYLKRLPVSSLKIDQSFVRDMLDDSEDLAILDGVLCLAVAFGRTVIAEGVENVAQGAVLLQLGCELAQGYGIARPMPGPDLPSWAANWRVDPSWLSQFKVQRVDLPLIFAEVDHRAWTHAMELFLKGERVAPPPMGEHACRFGHWMDVDGKPRHGHDPLFEKVHQLHHQVHALAERQIRLHSTGQSAKALQLMEELYVLRDALLEFMQGLLLKNKPLH